MDSQIALVTGVSHERGIGAAICKKLAMAGLNIFFTHWKSAPEWSDRFKNEIEELGVQCQSLEVDLSQSDSGRHVTGFSYCSVRFPNHISKQCRTFRKRWIYGVRHEDT